MKDDGTTGMLPFGEEPKAPRKAAKKTTAKKKTAGKTTVESHEVERQEGEKRSAEKEVAAPSTRTVYTVSEINGLARELLESSFGRVWIEAEISKFTAHANGHWYFTMKDATAAIDAVMFRAANNLVKFAPKTGLNVLAGGRLSLYERGGRYQVNVHALEPAGLGSLHLAFEQLKEKLEKEGLFDESRKKPVPVLPRKLGVVTSPSGEAVRDVLRALARRFGNIEVLIAPCLVQGEAAAPTIVSALEALNKRDDIDVIICGRGGGSMEDLWPFNEEVVARAIAASRLPVISAVGHERDVTIADYVADLRASTPTAAAEMVVAAKVDLKRRVEESQRRLRDSFTLRLRDARATVLDLARSRAFAGLVQRIQQHEQRVDDLQSRLHAAARNKIALAGGRVAAMREGLSPGHLRAVVQGRRQRLLGRVELLKARIREAVASRRAGLGRFAGMLESLSPLAVLERGYSIAFSASGALLRDASETAVGQNVTIKLQTGSLDARVEKIDRDGS